MIIAFTGHRPDKLGGWDNDTVQIEIMRRIEAALAVLKPDKCISGMALGVDQWAALVCIKMKIPFIAAVPFVGQESIWPDKSKELYKKILEKAEQVEIVSEGGYSVGKLQVRNQWMVDNCDMLVAVFDGSKGGTHNCVKYAEKKGKEVFLIKP